MASGPLHIKARSGEKVTDGLGTVITEKGGFAPATTFWFRRLKNNEVSLVERVDNSGEKEKRKVKTQD